MWQAAASAQRGMFRQRESLLSWLKKDAEIALIDERMPSHDS
jgi:hypothetical protein